MPIRFFMTVKAIALSKCGSKDFFNLKVSKDGSKL